MNQHNTAQERARQMTGLLDQPVNRERRRHRPVPAKVERAYVIRGGERRGARRHEPAIAH